MTTGWRWAIGAAVAIAVADLALAVLINKATRDWWTSRSAGTESGWPPRKRSAAILLIGVNLLVALVAVGRLLEASAAITAVTGALGAAALTQWNQRGQSDREAEDRRSEREEAARQRDEDRADAARRREEDRAEASAMRAEERAERRAEWVRERRFAAYEALLGAQINLLHAINDLGIVDPPRRQERLSASVVALEEIQRSLAMVRAYGSAEMQAVAFQVVEGGSNDPSAWFAAQTEHHGQVAEVVLHEVAALEGAPPPEA